MKMKITEKENQYLSDMVNKDSVIDVEDGLNLKIRNRSIRNIFRF